MSDPNPTDRGMDGSAASARLRIPQVWRDVDSTRRQFGIVVRPTGLSLYIGKRLYRALWRHS